MSASIHPLPPVQLPAAMECGDEEDSATEDEAEEKKTAPPQPTPYQSLLDDSQSDADLSSSDEEHPSSIRRMMAAAAAASATNNKQQGKRKKKDATKSAPAAAAASIFAMEIDDTPSAGPSTLKSATSSLKKKSTTSSSRSTTPAPSRPSSSSSQKKTTSKESTKKTPKSSATKRKSTTPTPTASSSSSSSTKKKKKKETSSSSSKSKSKVNRSVVKETLASNHTRSWPIPRDIIPKVEGSDSEDFCFKCRELGLQDEDGDLLPCRGICAHSWHLPCIPLRELPKTKHWFCDSCAAGEWPVEAKLDSECDEEETPPIEAEFQTTRTIVMAACGIHEKKGRESWLKHLCQLGSVKKSIRENTQDELGYTVLHHAATEHVPPKILLRFMQLGADVNIPDSAKTLAVHHAFSRQNIPAVLCFLTEPKLNLKHRARGAHTVFADCAGPNYGLGPGRTVQGLKGFYQFQLYFAFALRFTIQQEFQNHKPFEVPARSKNRPAAGYAHLQPEAVSDSDEIKVKKEPGLDDSADVAGGSAAARGLTDHQFAERGALLNYLEDRFSCLSLSILQFTLTILRDGLITAMQFDSKTFKLEVNQAAEEQNSNIVNDMDVDEEGKDEDRASASAAAAATISTSASIAQAAIHASTKPKRRSVPLSSMSLWSLKHKRPTQAKLIAHAIRELIVAECQANEALASSPDASPKPSALDAVRHAVTELEEEWLPTFNSCPQFNGLKGREVGPAVAEKVKPKKKKSDSTKKASSSKSKSTSSSTSSSPKVKIEKLDDSSPTSSSKMKKKRKTSSEPEAKKRRRSSSQSRSRTQSGSDGDASGSDDEHHSPPDDIGMFDDDAPRGLRLPSLSNHATDEDLMDASPAAAAASTTTSSKRHSSHASSNKKTAIELDQEEMEESKEEVVPDYPSVGPHLETMFVDVNRLHEIKRLLDQNPSQVQRAFLIQDFITHKKKIDGNLNASVETLINGKKRTLEE